MFNGGGDFLQIRLQLLLHVGIVVLVAMMLLAVPVLVDFDTFNDLFDFV